MHKLLLFIICLSSHVLFSQDYFQQNVDYKINVILNDTENQLEGTEILTYTNNSPNTIKEIYFHLWANAYKNKDSAFGKQNLRNNRKDFYFAKDNDRGGYLELSFSSNNAENEWFFDKKHQDIAIVELTAPLKPGEKTELIIHFTIKIPVPFSRFNRIKESYNITQWYPKPAVFDKNGWNPMPYLDFGEFYSEFGDYDITITLPADYIVAATGTLVTESEKKILEKIVQKTSQLFEGDSTIIFPKHDSTKTKTINLTAKKVHDFAWFANKNFLVQKKEFKLSNGDKKIAWAFFSKTKMDNWRNATMYIERAVQSIGDWVGNYPYPQATAVMSETPIGSDMEYPMITSIGPRARNKGLDIVITHEVGHNWFYGILGSNERIHAWMDEGINSFYEKKYTDIHYPKNKVSKREKARSIMGDTDESEWMLQLDRNKNNEASPDQDVEKMETFQYINADYTKPAIAFRYLESYLGKEAFESVMKLYYEKWKFKHPTPEDIRKIFETQTGKDLTWFFDDILSSTNQMDYAILSVKDEDETLEIKLGNLGEINAPILVDFIKDETVVYKKWIEGFSDVEIFSIPSLEYDEIVIDSKHLSIESNRHNNNYYFKGGKFNKITFKPLFSLKHSQQTRINYFPVIAWNNYDKYMFGISFYNIPIPANRFDYWITPLFSFKTQNLNGFARIRLNTFPKKGVISKIVLGLEAKRFTKNELLNQNDDRYQKINPYITIDFHSKPTSYLKHSISANAYYIKDGSFGHNIDQFISHKIFTLNYQIHNNHPIFPNYFNSEFENNNWFENNNYKVSFEYKQGWYYSKKSDINIRFFIGNSFIKNFSTISQYNTFSLFGNNFSDYKYNNISMYRQDFERIGYRQISETNGGFRSNTDSNIDMRTVSKTMFSTNLTASIPKFSFVKPYFDFAILSNNNSGTNQYWTTGISLGYKDYFGIYFPVASSFKLNNRKYLEKISFSINLKKIDPWKINFRKLLLNFIE